MNEKALRNGQKLLSEIDEIKRNLEHLKIMRRYNPYEVLKIETRIAREECFVWTYDTKIKEKIVASVTSIYEKELEKKQKEFEKL